MFKLEANRSIVPLLDWSDDDHVEFLGTGFFIEPHGLLLTAWHVVFGHEDSLAVMTTERLDETFSAVVVEADQAHDLALVWVEGYKPRKLFRIGHPREIRQNRQVMCLEYGTTEKLAGDIKFSAAARMGNVSRIIKQADWLGAAGVEALELSFPALRGASGAPVLDNLRLRLWGVITANVAHHLLPVQVESVVDETGQPISETQFMMPQAIAVNVRHVRGLLGLSP